MKSKSTPDIFKVFGTMAFIEGIGDEVIGMVVALIIITVLSIVWSSTHVQERPPVRAVIAQVSNRNQAGSTLIIASDLPAGLPGDTGQQTRATDGGTAEGNDQNSEVRNDGSNALIGNSSQSSGDLNNQQTTEISQTEGQKVKIKFQFLDETSLEVETHLLERIFGLKRRHLMPHLGLNSSNGDNVRLIFNGRVLQREQQTLSEAGLANNCVVHCLVQRGNSSQTTGRAATEGRQAATDAANPNDDNIEISELDLSNICYPLLGSVLMAIWWCQVVYTHYFSLTSTLSLISLTVLFLFSAANAFLH